MFAVWNINSQKLRLCGTENIILLSCSYFEWKAMNNLRKHAGWTNYKQIIYIFIALSHLHFLCSRECCEEQRMWASAENTRSPCAERKVSTCSDFTNGERSNTQIKSDFITDFAISTSWSTVHSLITLKMQHCEML